MHFFVSYAREDRQVCADLATGARRLGHDVWMDDELTGGQAWWDTILSEIRDCDGFLFLVSEASLESQACNRELSYAQALGKSVIPVGSMVLVPELLPPELAVLQCLDFSAQNRESVFQLAGALAGTPAAPPLPDPLPAEPPVPVSYMSELAQRVNAPSLTLDEQFAILARLRGALDRPRESEAARELLGRLRAREDLIYAVGRELAAILGDGAATPPSSGSEGHGPEHEPEPETGGEPTKGPGHAGPTTDRGPPIAPGEWRVEVVEQTPYARTLTVTRRQAHTLVCKIAYKLRRGSVGVELTMDEMRFDEKGVGSWGNVHREFKILDDGDVVPVEVTIKLDYRCSIKSYVLRMGGLTVHEEHRA